MASLNIRVGVTIDRDLSVAYRPLIAAAKKAKATIDAESKQAGRAISTNTKKGVDDAEAKFRELEKQVASGMPRAMNAGVAAIRQFGKEAASTFSQTKRQFEDLTRVAERQLAKLGRTASRPQGRDAGGGSGGGSSAVSSAGRAASGTAKRIASGVAGIATDVARGAGVQGASDLMQRNADLEKRVVALSNAAFMPGKGGAAGVRQDPKALEAEIRKIAVGTGTSSTDIAEGLQSFVSKTGDLQTARDSLMQMAQFAKATDSSLVDMESAAGDVANALEDGPDKGKRVYDVMRAIAGQGKEGAVEIKDLAVQMAKVSAASGSYQGSHADTMTTLGGLTQMARSKGGAASATQAATSVLSFTNTFDKGAREKAFKSFGVQTRDQSGKLLNANEIIKSALTRASSAEHGGMGAFSHNMGQMFMDANARRATRGYETIYKDAGGGAAGMAAVQKAMDEAQSAVMSQREIVDSFTATMDTAASKAEQFNEQWAASIAEVQKNMLPALQGLAPMIKSATDAIAKAAGILTGAPKNAQDDAGRRSGANAVNAYSDLRAGMRDRVVTKGEMAAGEKTLADLDAKIAEKKAHMSSKPGAGDAYLAGAMRIAGAGGNPIAALLGVGSGGKLANEYLEARNKTASEDQRQLALMQSDRDEVAKTLTQIKDGVLKVEIVADRTATAGGSPDVPAGGRQAPPEQKAGR